MPHLTPRCSRLWVSIICKWCCQRSWSQWPIEIHDESKRIYCQCLAGFLCFTTSRNTFGSPQATNFICSGNRTVKSDTTHQVVSRQLSEKHLTDICEATLLARTIIEYRRSRRSRCCHVVWYVNSFSINLLNCFQSWSQFQSISSVPLGSMMPPTMFFYEWLPSTRHLMAASPSSLESSAMGAILSAIRSSTKSWVLLFLFCILPCCRSFETNSSCWLTSYQISKEEESGAQDAEVTREDQDRINKFSRLHQREKTLIEEVAVKTVSLFLPSSS